METIGATLSTKCVLDGAEPVWVYILNTLNSKYDVIIIGAGITGLAVAGN